MWLLQLHTHTYGVVPIIEYKQQNPALYKLENFEGENGICCTHDEYRKAP